MRHGARSYLLIELANDGHGDWGKYIDGVR